MEVKDVFGALPSIETPRLLLRPLRPGDVDDLYAYASDPEVARYTLWEAHRTRLDSLDFLSWVMDLYTRGDVAPWGVVLKSKDRLVGTCGFICWNLDNARAEIGYALGRTWWGRGLVTEAVRAVVRFGFDVMHLNRIQARCEVPNVASARVMEKAGMQREGLLREHEFAKGRYLDMLIYSILAREIDAGA